MKKIKITNKQIIESVEGLNELLASKIPNTLSFKIAKNLKAINPLLELINIERQKIVDDYAKTDIIKFREEERNLLEVENEIDIEVFNEDEFVKKLGDLPIKPSVYMNEWMFEEK